MAVDLKPTVNLFYPKSISEAEKALTSHLVNAIAPQVKILSALGYRRYTTSMISPLQPSQNLALKDYDIEPFFQSAVLPENIRKFICYPP